MKKAVTVPVADKRWLTMAELCALLSCGKDKVYEMQDDGLKRVKHKGFILYDRNDVDKFLELHKV